MGQPAQSVPTGMEGKTVGVRGAFSKGKNRTDVKKAKGNTNQARSKRQTVWHSTG